MTDREAFEAWKNRPVRLAGEYVPMWQTWGPGEERIALETWQAALASERHWARKSVVAWLDPSDPDADSCIVLDRIRKHGKDNGMEWWKRYTVPLYAAPPADDEGMKLLRAVSAEYEDGQIPGQLVAAIDAYLAKVKK